MSNPINYNPYNTPLPYNPPFVPPEPFPPPKATQPYCGPQRPPKGPYGKFTNDGFLINYNGLASDTAEVIIDNANRYIKVNVYDTLPGLVEVLEEDPSISDMKEGKVWYNSTENVLKYFDGDTVIILQNQNEYLTEDDIDTIWENVDG